MISGWLGSSGRLTDPSDYPAKRRKAEYVTDNARQVRKAGPSAISLAEEPSIFASATVKVIRRQFKRMDQQLVAQLPLERQLSIQRLTARRRQLHESLRSVSQAENHPVDSAINRPQTVVA
jgi:hypothetical protein